MEGPPPDKPEETGKGEASSQPAENAGGEPVADKRPRRGRWRSWFAWIGGAILLLLVAAALIVIFRPVWVLNPLFDAAAKDRDKIHLKGARWVSPRELELSGLMITGTNKVGRARIELDYREFIGLEPAREKGDRENIRLTDVVLARLGKIDWANLKVDLGATIAAALARGVLPEPISIPAELIVSNLTTSATGRIGAVHMDFDFWDAVSSARNPERRLLEPPRQAEVSISGIAMGPTNRIDVARIQFDLGRAIALAMGPTNVPMTSLTNLFDLKMSGLAIGPTGKIDTVHARIDLPAAVATIMNPSNAAAYSTTGLTEIAVSGMDFGSIGRIDSMNLRLDLSEAVAAAIRPDVAPPMPGQTNLPSLVDVNISGLSIGPSGRVDTAHAKMDVRTAVAAAMDPSGAAGRGLTGLTEIGVSGIALGSTGRIETVSLNLDLAAIIATAIRPQAIQMTPGTTNLHEVVLSNIDLGDLGMIRSLRVRFDPLAAIRAFQRAARSGGQPELVIHEVIVDQPRLSIARQDIQTMQQRSAARGPKIPTGPLVEIGQVQIVEGLLQVKNLGPTLPPLPIRLDQVVSNVVFGAARDHPSAAKSLTIHVRDWTLHSPYDPLATVIQLKSIAISFSVRGLAENRLDRMEFVEPTIYVGQDLFWLSDLIKKEAAMRGKSEGEKKVWSVGEFDVRGGRVIVATQGKPDLELPFVFTASQKDLRFVSLRDLHLNAVIDVVPVSLDYRERYGIAVDNLWGKLEFALPRGNRNANNVVNTLKADRIAWKDLSASNSWVSVTFDVNGIYGRFGGESYGGYINGDGTLLFKNERDWVASVAGTKVDLGDAAADLVPQHVRLTGRGTGTVVVQGRERTILETSGKFQLIDQGKLEILALDEVLKRIPSDWSVTKKDLAKIVLEAFRNYHYTSGDTDFLYRPPQSYLRANFRGVEGKRDFEVTYDHEPQDTTN